jgi:intron-binding protein aquarius
MEEAGQVLELETLIPMLLQREESSVDACRLKRVVLIGDHLQLPPVVKNDVFRSYSRLDQSLFSRLVRIGVPAVCLERQGRCRPDIARLFSWRYGPDSGVSSLADLPCVNGGEYLYANAGLLHAVQVVDVPAFKGRGESSPTPFFYQNLGEAEYIVAVYMYMRLQGYPREKISILSTYNGQVQLIKDVLAQRCKGPLFGSPAAVATVDRYQGQQNDFVLLSLVRTAAVGHVRDVRRLVVAMSRARLGLYIFCRLSRFQQCLELAPVFSQLADRDTSLALVVNDKYPTDRGANDKVDVASVSKMRDAIEMGTLVYKMIQDLQSVPVE